MADVSDGAPPPDLLSSKQVAAFVAHGFVRLDEVVPANLCAAALAEIAAGALQATALPGQPLDDAWARSPALGPILRLPAVAGAIESLVGPRARYDHHHAHVVPPRQLWSQPWHTDAILDPRPFAFDIQLFFFFHDTPREAGGTMILPGSHFRRVNESDVGRYQNFRGQIATVCRAGTLVCCHHGLWHCGQPNHTHAPRTLLKVRVAPSGRQLRPWDLRDIDDPAIADTLRFTHPWTGGDARLEIVQRIKLWRHLTGNATFDVDHWLTRIEEPQGA
ncbi:MAG: phytanoyl-CoA dioxygenase family protein [Haliangium ochraceum]